MAGVRLMKIFILIAVAFVIASCSDEEYLQSVGSKKIWKLLESKDFKFIDFSAYSDDVWSKVCFLGPYNEQSEKVLGFSWHISEHTDVLKSDGHNVIIFATESNVAEYVVHSRGYGDFWKLSGECYSRENSKFIKDKESGSWKNYVQKKA